MAVKRNTLLIIGAILLLGNIFFFSFIKFEAYSSLKNILFSIAILVIFYFLIKKKEIESRKISKIEKIVYIIAPIGLYSFYIGLLSILVSVFLKSPFLAVTAIILLAVGVLCILTVLVLALVELLIRFLKKK